MTELIKRLRQETGSGFLDCKKALEASGGDIEAAKRWLVEKGVIKAASRAGRIAAQGAVKTKILSDGSALILELNCETDFVARNQGFLDLLTKLTELVASAVETSSNKEVDFEELVRLCEPETTNFSQQSGEKISLRRVELLRPVEGGFIAEYTHINNQFAVLVSVRGEVAKRDAARSVAMHIGALKPRFALRADLPTQELSRLENEVKSSPALVGKPEAVYQRIFDGLLTKQFSEFVAEDQPFAMEPSLTVRAFLSSNSLTLVSFVRFEVAEGIERGETVDFACEVLSQIKRD